MKTYALMFFQIVVTALAVAPLRAAAPPPEKLLGVDVLMVLTVPDWKKATADYESWPASQFWRDPAMKPFREKFMGKLESELVAPLEKKLGIKFSDYQDLLEGQATLAVTKNGWGEGEGREPGMLLLLDAGSKQSEMKMRLDELERKWTESGKALRKEQIRGLEFTSVDISPQELAKSLENALPGGEEESPEAAEESEEEKPEPLLIGLSESLLVVGSSRDDIEKLLARKAGSTLASLSDNANYNVQSGAHLRNAAAYLWVNLNLVINTIVSQVSDPQQPSENPLMPAPGALISALGLLGLDALTVAYTELPEGSMLTTSILAPESKRQGLLKIFQIEPKDSSPPTFVPEDAVKFSRLRLDLEEAWNNLEQTLTKAVPPLAGVLSMMLDNAGKDESNPDFDLRKNLIANLGDDIVSYQKKPKTADLAGMTSPPSIVMIGSPRAQELAGAIRALGALMPQQGGATVKEREFLGRTIYSMPLPQGMATEQGAVESSLHYVANAGYVAFSTDAVMIEEYLRTSSVKPLRATTGLVSATEKVGGMNLGLMTYEDHAETMRNAFEVLKKESGTLANLFQGAGVTQRLGVGGDNDKLKEWLDFSLLPPFEQVAKYFYFSVSGGALTSEGYTFKYYSPKPPALR